MKYEYTVITAIPDIKGNLYNPILYKSDGTVFTEAMAFSSEYGGGSTTGPLAENFEVGEILILDPEIGREISGRQRKPSKWRVETETFDTIEKAIERALQITNTL